MQNAQDGTIIVPNEALQAIIEKYELEKEDADKLQKSLSGGFALFEEWKAKNSELVVDRADQVAEMTKASEGAKAMQKARTGFVKDWQAIKAPYLKTTQALDAINRFVTTEFKALESELQEKANVGARLAQAEKDLVVANRKLALQEIGHNGEIPGLGEMSEETFEMILSGAKEKVRLQREQEAQEAADREAAELAAKQETERLANLEKTINARVLKLVEIGAKRDNDDVPSLVLGNRAIAIHVMGAMEQETFDLFSREFQAEADRIKAIERAEQDRKERFGSRVRVLLTLGAKEIQDGDNSRIELGNSKVILADLATLNEADARWDFTLTSFQDEAQRIKDAEVERLALDQRTNDRKNQLARIGAEFSVGHDGGKFRLGNVDVALNHVENNDDSAWEKVMEMFASEVLRIRQASELKAQQERERLQTANDRLAQLRNVEFNALFVDVADLTDVEFDALLKVRTNEFNATKERQRITNLGLMRKPLLDAQGEIRNADFLGGLTNDEFQAMLDNATRLKANADQQRANEAAQAAIEAQRKADEAKRLKDEENARKKAESATDKEKLEDMVKQIQAIVMPTCSSIQGDAIARGAIDRLNKIVGHMHEAMNNM